MSDQPTDMERSLRVAREWATEVARSIEQLEARLDDSRRNGEDPLMILHTQRIYDGYRVAREGWKLVCGGIEGLKAMESDA